MSILPGELGCLTKSDNMRMTTMTGKRITTPRGTDMLEFPFNRSGLLKKANRDDILLGRGVAPFSSIDGSCGARDGANRDTRRKRSIVDEGINVLFPRCIEF